jgi:hypothetical protein
LDNDAHDSERNGHDKQEVKNHEELAIPSELQELPIQCGKACGSNP